MPKFSANLSTMFREFPFPRRFDAAAACGFSAVEMQFPYEYPAEDVATWAHNAGVKVDLLNSPPGDWAAGDRGLAAIPGREEEFQKSLEQALRYARLLRASKLHVMAGVTTAGAAHDTYIGNLRWASKRAAENGVTLVIEALNTVDVPNYLVHLQTQTAAMVEKIASPYLKMQIDCYHMGMMQEDCCAILRRYSDLCGHVQIADAPGRNEPGTGTLDFAAIFRTLDEIGYRDWVGCEYIATGDTRAGLRWREHFQPRQ